MSIRVFIGADIVPTFNNYKQFENGDVISLIGDKLNRMLSKSDLTIFNLEVPIVDEENPIIKCGPNLIAPIRTIKGLKKINPFFYGLANNHIMDQGEKGLYSTIEQLKVNNICYAGAGKNIEEAKKPFIFEKNSIRIGIYCCSEHEFSIAANNKAGANPYDPLNSFDDVYDLKQQCDYTIVLYHGGREHYRYPTPELQKIFRKFAQKGADLVIAQHTHCIGSFEQYNESLLVYGQGNFLFTMQHDEYWDSSLLIELELKKGYKPKVNYHPIISKDNHVLLANQVEKEKILLDFWKRSEEIKEKGFIEKKFNQYVKTQGENYSKVIKGESGIFKRLYLKLSKRTFDFHYRGQRLLSLLNYIECETHREIVIQEIKRCLQEKYDCMNREEDINE